MKISPQVTKEKGIYDKQEQLHEFFAPADGLYIVANVALQRQLIANKEDPKHPHHKLRVRPTILRVLESEASKAEQDDYVGKNFAFDLWMNNQAKNQAIFSCLVLAHNPAYQGELDTEDDGQLVRVITATPYIIRTKKNTRQFTDRDGKAQSRSDIQPVEFRDLESHGFKQAARDALTTKNPDWQKIIGDPAQRMRETQDWSSGDGGGAASGGGGRAQGNGRSHASHPPQEDDPFAARR